MSLDFHCCSIYLMAIGQVWFVLNSYFNFPSGLIFREDSALSLLTTENSYAPNPIPSIKFENVKGNNEAKEELSDLVGYLSSPSKYETAIIPKGILLSMLDCYRFQVWFFPDV
jgi:ATP-dependent Zn protease